MDFNILVLSDVHLYHRRTKTEQILFELDEMLNANHEQVGREIDLIFISGDFFDRMVEMPTPDFFLIIRWVRKFVDYCRRHNIVLRVLEGTGSHDYGQSAIFEELGASEIDVRYVSSVSVEYVERFGIHVLYVPDEVNADASLTYQEVRRVLGTAGVEKVDYAVMHGFFDFQIPVGVDNTIAHRSDLYRELVSRYVFIGHHHTHQIRHNICVPGSFSRLKQGEEEDKGHITCAHGSQKSTVRHVVNYLAKTYETIDLSHLDMKAIYRQLERLKEYRPGSEIKLVIDKHSEVNEIIKDIRSAYPHINFDIAKVTLNKRGETPRKLLQTYQPITIKPDNIVALMAARIAKREDSQYILSLLERNLT